jgi:KUP system potassium uptake protein
MSQQTASKSHGSIPLCASVPDGSSYPPWWAARRFWPTGILTPAVTVTTAIEGLRTVDFGYALIGDSQRKVVAITIVIICALYIVQKAGTSSIGKLFGPIMTLWFLFLGGAGLVHFIENPGVIRALNPLRGLMFLASPNNHAGLRILGFVFLCTTGAEALYSDMGHVGKSNIYAFPLAYASSR